LHIYQIKKLYTKHFQNIPKFSNLVYVDKLATLETYSTISN